MNKDLTLEKAITIIKQAEQVRGQQDVLRNSEGEGHSGTTDLHVIRYKPRDIRSTESRKKPALKLKGRKLPQHTQDTASKWCSRTPSLKRADCPAKDVTCHACNKTGHFRNVCKSSVGKPSHPSTVNDITWDASNVFLDVLELAKNSDAWYAVFGVDGWHDIKFKLDIGADVIVIPTNLFKQLTPYSFTNTDACLSCATGSALNVRSKFEAMLTWRSKRCSTEIFVADNVRINAAIQTQHN